MPNVAAPPRETGHEVRLGYFVPEFPGSTHIFFWRELRALEAAGCDSQIVSSHRPPASRISHAWSQEAMNRTTYLLPPRPGRVLGGVWEIVRSGRSGWARCARAIFSAEGYSSLKGRARMAALLLMGGQLARLGRRRGWDHVHVHSCADTAHVAMFARLLSGLPYSLTLHGHVGDYGPNQRNKWKHAAFGIVITHRLLKVMRELLNGDLPVTVEVAPMGVEVSSFARSRPYEPWTGSGPCRIFSCGRLNPCKGHDHLIQAIAQLRDMGFDPELRIAGADDHVTGEHRALLERLTNELNLNGKVKLLGAVSEEVVRRELESAHVFALASRRDELGVATMEAMAMGVPVIVSRSGAIDEMIDDGIDGLLVEKENPRSMAEGIARVLRDPQLAVRLGQAGRIKIEAKFHSDISAQLLLRCLGMNARPGAPPPEGERIVPRGTGVPPVQTIEHGRDARATGRQHSPPNPVESR
jgi:glycosyltransferase involved in cell wall biosynthesis